MEKEKLDLTKILKDCPKGTKLYSPIFGKVEFSHIITKNDYPIWVRTEHSGLEDFSSDGRFYNNYSDSECMLFPSKEQRDWDKFVAPKPDLPEGTWVMCEDNIREPIWGLYRYRANAVVTLCLDEGVEFSWKYIIPFDKFDPNNIEECIEKYNYGTRKVN